MSSETGATGAETQPQASGLNRTLVIGLGTAGAGICGRVIRYSTERHGGAPVPGLECLHIGPAADKHYHAGENSSTVELEYPGIISAADYAALREEEAWGWLPAAGTEEVSARVPGARFHARAALFNTVTKVRAELLRLREAAGGRAGEQVSIYIAADAGETAGSALFIDIAALAYDTFGPLRPRVCGILLLPGRDSSRRERADGYALFKETDFFMQGGTMRFVYPDGSGAVMNGRVFGNGNLFILDRQQFNAACEGRDRTGVDHAASYIELMSVTSPHDFTPASDMPGAFQYWSSFGIYRGLNPYAASTGAETEHAIAAVLDEFFKPVDPDRLLHELERIRSVPGAPCGPECPDIIRRMNPACAGMADAVAAEIRERIDRASADNDHEKIMETCREIADAYSAHGVERFRYGLVSAMKIRASIELEKARILLLPEIHAIVNDPGMGFYFTLAVLDSMADRLKSFHETFRSSAGKIDLYTADRIMPGLEESAGGAAEAVVTMASFNYRQFLHLCMVEASIFYLEKFILFLNDVRESVSERIIIPAARLRADSRTPDRAKEGSLNNGAALPGIDVTGIAGLLEPAGLLDAAPGAFYGGASDYSWLKEKLCSMLGSRIDSAAASGQGASGGANPQESINRMLACSRPAVDLLVSAASTQGITATLYTCEPLPGDVQTGLEAAGNKDAAVRTAPHPGFRLQHEAAMVSLVHGFTLRDVSRLDDCSRCYHELAATMEPLHLFNGAGNNNALYFPDPHGYEYMEPAMLWSALLLLKLVKEESGTYIPDEPVIPLFRETSARMKYKKVITDTGRRLMEGETAGPAGFELVADAVNMLGMLAKGSSGGIVFRREYASAISEILDAHDSVRSVSGQSGVQQEVFSTTGDIASFLAAHPAVAEFILNTIKSIIAATDSGNASGSFVMLPASRIAQTPLPSFDSAASFADYCMEYGAPGFYSAIKNVLTVKLDGYISSRFGVINGTPGQVSGVAEFLRALEARVPLCVIRDVKVKYGVRPE